MIDLDSLIRLDNATLLTMRTETLAEISRQKVAGGTFGTPVGQHRTGVNFPDLFAELKAINMALEVNGYLTSPLIHDTVADCSAENP